MIGIGDIGIDAIFVSGDGDNLYNVTGRKTRIRSVYIY